MKLADLLKEIDPKGFHTRRKGANYGVDPEDGSITWSVTYAEAKLLDKKLEEVVELLNRMENKNKGDKKLSELSEIFKKFKKAFRTHITKNYS
jgi:hypothetical protein